MKKDYNVVQFSGGKDSTAMLLHMIELDMPIDEIIFCDTGLEFPEMYEHIEKVEKYIGRKITKLKHKKSFEYYLLDHVFTTKDGNKIKGRGFASPRSRWCTKTLKVDESAKWLKEKSKEYNIKLYIGIAADEQKRIKEHNYPLVEWGWTEKDCLEYCYSRGFDWGGLYKYFKRVSCWCCPLQCMDDLRQLWKHFPHLWTKLENLQNRSWTSFKCGKRIPYFTERFKFEEEWRKKGLPIGRNKKFQTALKEHLKNIDEDNLYSPKNFKEVIIKYYKKYEEFDTHKYRELIKDVYNDK